MYHVKVNGAIVKRTTNQKEAQTVFHKERARHGGKAKFFVIRHFKS